jgi:ADP-heptose:LPS heptosyltransferase
VIYEEALLSQTPPKKILLPRFDTLGDLVLLEGFLEALRQRLPQAKVTLLNRRVFADLSSLLPDSPEWLTTDIDPHKQASQP